jgi:hypothetical protein
VRGGEHKGNSKINWPQTKADQIGSGEIAYLTGMKGISLLIAFGIIRIYQI